jgi:hypothetical protein
MCSRKLCPMEWQIASVEYSVGSGSCQPLPASRTCARSSMDWGRRSSWSAKPSASTASASCTWPPGSSTKVSGRGASSPRRQLLSGHQQQAVGGAGIALHEGEAVIGDQEIERDLAGVAQLGHDRFDQLQWLGGVDRLELDAGAVLALPGIRYIRWELTRPW